jgi:outer membrane protein OmpA-like peptidoglycan-associated protein
MSNELLAVMKEQIQFEPNQAKFTPSGLEVLNKVAAVLKKTEYKTLKVIIEGHAACPGDCKDPVCGLSQLAKLRTEAVIKALKVRFEVFSEYA